MYCILQYCSSSNKKSASAVNRAGVGRAGAKNCDVAPLAWRKSCAPTPTFLEGWLEASGTMRNAIQESLTARVQGLHERAVWPRSQVPDARVGQIVEFTPSRPRGYYLARQTDAGSVPCSASKAASPNLLRASLCLQCVAVLARSRGLSLRAPLPLSCSWSKRLALLKCCACRRPSLGVFPFAYGAG